MEKVKGFSFIGSEISLKMVLLIVLLFQKILNDLKWKYLSPTTSCADTFTVAVFDIFKGSVCLRVSGIKDKRG